MTRSLRIVAIALGAVMMLAWPATGRAQDRYLVIPFEYTGRDAALSWLSEASAVLLADDLNALGRRAYTRDERLEAFGQLQVPAVTNLTHATVIRLGQLVGATHVIFGSLSMTGTRLSLRAQSIRLDAGRM